MTWPEWTRALSIAYLAATSRIATSNFNLNLVARDNYSALIDKKIFLVKEIKI